MYFITTENKSDALAEAKRNDKQGIMRFSLVTSGKKLDDEDVEKACTAIRHIKEQTGIQVCVSMGLLDENNFKKLKDAGVSRVHNNLETSKNNFSNVCTTHTFEDKTAAIRAAASAGLTVCSGGIMGLGEPM